MSRIPVTRCSFASAVLAGGFGLEAAEQGNPPASAPRAGELHIGSLYLFVQKLADASPAADVISAAGAPLVPAMAKAACGGPGENCFMRTISPRRVTANPR